MERERKEELYGAILEAAQSLRTEIAQEYVDELAFGGVMPAEARNELRHVGEITQVTFESLKALGYETEMVPGKPQETIVLLGKKYASLIQDEKNKKEEVSSAKEPVSLPTGGRAEGSKEPEAKELKAPAETTSSFAPDRAAYCEEPAKEDPVEVESKPEMEAEPNSTELPDSTFLQSEPPAYDANADFSQYGTFEPETDSESFEEEEQEDTAPEEEEEPQGLPVRSFESAPQVSAADMASLFVEEKRKAYSEFVYDTYRISVAHKDMGGRPEEMFVFIAPLKISKFAAPSVPVLVSIYYKGKMYQASSYDRQEEGKNLLNIDVNEYYFLCRGMFKDDGTFESTIVTTGISSDQGDLLNVISKEKHGNPKNAKNGHLKFKFSPSENGIVEIFPLEKGEKDFIIMTRTDEFTDYMYMSDSVGGLSKPIVFDDGIKREVVCNWDGDYLEAELV